MANRLTGRAALALAALAAGGPGAAADAELTFSVDIPTTLESTTYLANQTIDYQSTDLPNYVLSFGGGVLEESIDLDAVTLLPGGDFLFSTDLPFTADSVEYTAQDVVLYEIGPGTYSMYLAGSSLGLSPEADIDAVGFDELGRLALSFALPETVDDVTYQFNDVVVVDGGSLSLLVSGVDIGLPEELNVTGYERTADGDDLFHFDLPVTLGSEDFVPSDVARYSAGTWSMHFHDPDFPPESAGTDFSLPCIGPAYAGLLRAGRVGGLTELSWTAAGSARFDVVRGDLPTLRTSSGNFTLALDAIVPGSDVCMTDDDTLLAVTDTRPNPAPNGAYFYVLRAVAGCGAGGTYDSGGPRQVGSRDAEIAAAADDCP